MVTTRSTRPARVAAAAAAALLGTATALALYAAPAAASVTPASAAAPPSPAVPAAAPAAKLSQAEAEARLSGAGITWSSSGGCTDRNTPTCTSFEQINDTTVAGVITLKQASGCAVNITGGTEVGHADGAQSHYNGFKVDLSLSSCLDGYIKGAFARIGDRGDGYPQWQATSGNIYCEEGDHWDIVYTSAG